MLKGDKCLSPKCPLERRHAPQGRRPRPRRVSEYGYRLKEKQKVRHIYGVQERQLRGHFAKAERRSGLAGENLLKILELRFDNVIYRLGFADSRRQARQLVRHGHFLINGRKVDIPSYSVKPGDVITWKEKSKALVPYNKAVQGVKSVPTWLSLDPETLTGRILTEPSRNDIDLTIEEQLIVEYYSR
jgi:small subunit ribosomal protein S4